MTVRAKCLKCEVVCYMFWDIRPKPVKVFAICQKLQAAPSGMYALMQSDIAILRIAKYAQQLLLLRFPNKVHPQKLKSHVSICKFMCFKAWPVAILGNIKNVGTQMLYA